MTDEKRLNRIVRFGRNMKGFLYGMTAYETAQCARKGRGGMNDLFVLITLGNMLGIPIPPPYYSLRLLPYFVSQISAWKHKMLREKDFMDTLA